MGSLTILLIVGGLVWFLGRRRGNGGDPLEELLTSATAAGIIDDEQRRALLEHADAHEPAGFSGALWLAILASLFVVAGISLLIATNWENIGPVVRVGGYLALLAVVGEAAIRARSPGIALALQLGWLLLPLLGIGLYAQTFQLSGAPTTSLLVWLGLGVPLVWTRSHPGIAVVHTGALAAVLLWASFLAPGPLLLTGGAPSAWGLSFATLALFLLQADRKLPDGQKAHALGVAAAWIFGAVTIAPPFELHDGAWAFLLAAALSTLWLAIVLLRRSGPGEEGSAALAWLAVPYAMTFTWHADDALIGDTNPASMVATSLLVVAAVVAVWRVPPDRFPGGPLLARLLLVAPLFLAAGFFGGLGAIHATAVLANVFLVVTSAILLWHGSTEQRTEVVNVGILVLLVVLVTRFLDVFGSFVQTGLGFIVAGVLLAALAYGLERIRRGLVSERAQKEGR